MNLGKGLVALVIIGIIVFFAMRSGKSKDSGANLPVAGEQAPMNTGDRDVKVPVEEKYGFTTEGLNQ